MRPPSDLTTAGLFTWMAERLIYFAVIILLFLGSAFASIFSETPSTLPWYKQAFAMFFSVTLMGLLMGYLLSTYELNPYAMCVLAAFLGMGGSRVSKWMLNIWEKSQGFEDFAHRVGTIIFAVRRAIKDTEQQAPEHHDAPTE